EFVDSVVEWSATDWGHVADGYVRIEIGPARRLADMKRPRRLVKTVFPHDVNLPIGPYSGDRSLVDGARTGCEDHRRTPSGARIGGPHHFDLPVIARCEIGIGHVDVLGTRAVIDPKEALVRAEARSEVGRNCGRIPGKVASFKVALVDT